MFETYSSHALSEAKLSLKIVDENLQSDFFDYKLDDIPNDSEWHIKNQIML